MSNIHTPLYFCTTLHFGLIQNSHWAINLWAFKPSALLIRQITTWAYPFADSPAPCFSCVEWRSTSLKCLPSIFCKWHIFFLVDFKKYMLLQLSTHFNRKHHQFVVQDGLLVCEVALVLQNFTTSSGTSLEEVLLCLSSLSSSSTGGNQDSLV